MIWLVVAPLVVVRSHGKVVYRAEGQRVDGVSESDAARLVARGLIAATDEAAPAPAAPTPPAAPDAPVADGGKPKKTHGIDKWQAYAMSQGLSAEDVEGATKAELIALVG